MLHLCDFGCPTLKRYALYEHEKSAHHRDAEAVRLLSASDTDSDSRLPSPILLHLSDFTNFTAEFALSTDAEVTDLCGQKQMEHGG